MHLKIVSQFHKLGQWRRFLGNLLGPLLKPGWPLMKIVLKPLTKTILIPIGLTAAVPARDAAIHEKTFGSGIIMLIMPSEEMNDTK